MREQADLLDHVAHLSPQLRRRSRGHRAAADLDVAGGDLDGAVDHPHRRGLATAGGADEDADLAGLDLEAEVADGVRFGAAVALGDVAERNRSGRVSFPGLCSPSPGQREADTTAAGRG